MLKIVIPRGVSPLLVNHHAKTRVGLDIHLCRLYKKVVYFFLGKSFLYRCLYKREVLCIFESMVITDEGIRIEIGLPPLSDRRSCKVKEGYMMLYEGYVEYKMVAEYEELNEDTAIWELKKSNYRFTRKRSRFSDVAMLFCNKEMLWQVTVDFDGVDDGYKGWWYDDPKEAHKTYKILQDYLLDRDDT